MPIPIDPPHIPVLPPQMGRNREAWLRAARELAGIMDYETATPDDARGLPVAVAAVAVAEPAPRPVLVAEPTPIAAVAPVAVVAAKAGDDFSSLEQRILQAVELVRRERQARIAAEEKLAAYEADVLEQLPLVDRLQQEVDLLRAEREQIKQRVDRLLTQLDSLEL